MKIHIIEKYIPGEKINIKNHCVIELHKFAKAKYTNNAHAFQRIKSPANHEKDGEGPLSRKSEHHVVGRLQDCPSMAHDLDAILDHFSDNVDKLSTDAPARALLVKLFQRTVTTQVAVQAHGHVTVDEGSAVQAQRVEKGMVRTEHVLLVVAVKCVQNSLIL